VRRVHARRRALEHDGVRAVAHRAAQQLQRGVVLDDDGARGARALRRVDLTVAQQPAAARDRDGLAHEVAQLQPRDDADAVGGGERAALQHELALHRHVAVGLQLERLQHVHLQRG